jgi:hypothetical protein
MGIGLIPGPQTPGDWWCARLAIAPHRVRPEAVLGSSGLRNEHHRPARAEGQVSALSLLTELDAFYSRLDGTTTAAFPAHGISAGASLRDLGRHGHAGGGPQELAEFVWVDVDGFVELVVKELHVQETREGALRARAQESGAAPVIPINGERGVDIGPADPRLLRTTLVFPVLRRWRQDYAAGGTAV